MKLTPEQEAVVARDLAPGEVVKVIAFAGTGKTTTLVRYAAARPRMRFLYVAFNKSVQLDAAARFPANVVCKTSHALAFARFGAKHRQRLVPGFKANTVMQALGLDGYEAAKFAIDTLMNYLVSADARVGKRHIPFVCRQYFEALKRPMPDVVALANRLGRLMCTAENPEIGMLHDGYLKLFQLSRPRLGCDCILLDEAQDINPVTAEVILSQPETPKILVGDPNQQIYSFRGAQNSLARVKSSETLYLTGSFRFHAKIAAVANLVLRQFKGEQKKLRGLRKKRAAASGGPQTVIARTNAKIFEEAAAQTRRGKKVGFVGGIGGYRFNRLLDVYRLFQGAPHRIRDPYIRSFPSFGELEAYARAVEDREAMSLCKVVQNHRHQIPLQVRAITEKAVDEKQAEVVLTTAHKAKGLEWSDVTLADDFPDLVVGGEPISKDDLEADEFNLIYVSLTRAMDRLRLAPGCSLQALLTHVRQQKVSKPPPPDR
jgi:F-box protein, helicase, 18